MIVMQYGLNRNTANNTVSLVSKFQFTCVEEGFASGIGVVDTDEEDVPGASVFLSEGAGALKPGQIDYLAA